MADDAPMSPQPSLSPCIGICRLDAEDICLGCERSMAEIRSWGLLSRTQQRKILTRIQLQRRQLAAPPSLHPEQPS